MDNRPKPFPSLWFPLLGPALVLGLLLLLAMAAKGDTLLFPLFVVPFAILTGAVLLLIRLAGRQSGWLTSLLVLGYIGAQVVVLGALYFAACAATAGPF